MVFGHALPCRVLTLALGAFFAGSSFANTFLNDPNQVQFFTNSVRREADVTERGQVAKAKGCASFFLENSAGKTFVASARHCFGYAATNWCKTGTFKDNDGNVAKCKRFVAGDLQRDIIVMEADFATPPQGHISSSVVDAGSGHAPEDDWLPMRQISQVCADRDRELLDP